MNGLMNLLTYWSQSWRRVFLVFLLNSVSAAILLALEERFTAVTGLPVFDTQNELTVAMMVEQLPAYQGQALTAYYQFSAFDFWFPLIGGLFFAVVVTWLLRQSRLPLAQRAIERKLPLIFLASTLFDWLENIGFLTVIGQGTAVSELTIRVALLFKQLKLFFLNGSSALLLILIVTTIIVRLSGRFSKKEGQLS